MDIMIREAVEDDYEELMELFAAGTDIHHAGEPGIIAPSSERVMPKEYISRVISGLNSGLLVAERVEADGTGGGVVGFVQLMLHSMEDQQGIVLRHYALLTDIEVGEEYRGHGIGHKLMAAAEAWAVEHGASQVELTVWEFNVRARALYEELGYRVIYRQMLKVLSPESLGQGDRVIP